jgi:hypothetical protein
LFQINRQQPEILPLLRRGMLPDQPLETDQEAGFGD